MKIRSNNKEWICIWPYIPRNNKMIFWREYCSYSHYVIFLFVNRTCIDLFWNYGWWFPFRDWQWEVIISVLATFPLTASVKLGSQIVICFVALFHIFFKVALKSMWYLIIRTTISPDITTTATTTPSPSLKPPPRPPPPPSRPPPPQSPPTTTQRRI